MAKPADDFISRVLEIVDSIPPGRVMAYGDVAAAMGSRAARAVGTVMSHYGSDAPWWRVVRASGHPPIDHEQRALEHYRAEGTPLKWSASTYRVDLPAARFHNSGGGGAGGGNGADEVTPAVTHHPGHTPS